jgi:hypothetical protein
MKGFGKSFWDEYGDHLIQVIGIITCAAFTIGFSPAIAALWNVDVVSARHIEIGALVIAAATFWKFGGVKTPARCLAIFLGAMSYHFDQWFGIIGAIALYAAAGFFEFNFWHDRIGSFIGAAMLHVPLFAATLAMHNVLQGDTSTAWVRFGAASVATFFIITALCLRNTEHLCEIEDDGD